MSETTPESTPETSGAAQAVKAEGARGNYKERVGKVVSNKMDKTIVVTVDRLVRHPVYHKVMKKTKRLYAHDEKNECNIGDTVRVIETRPMSRSKRWRLTEVIERAK